MNRNFGPRLKRLEASLLEMERRTTEIRVAGRGPLEFIADVLAEFFCRIESAKPGAAAAFLEASRLDDGGEVLAEESTDDDTMLKVLNMIRLAERLNPGVPQRVLDAILSGAEAITEETVWPDGRPSEDETFDSRKGKRYFYRLNAVGQTRQQG